jgi:cytochrome b pre-mRNA-processing protein 3
LLKWLFRSAGGDEGARIAYAAIVAQSRRPEFYHRLGVPDTLDGRFDMIVLHTFLLLNRLKGQGRAADDFGRRVTEALVSDMDANLRELGVGDLAVPKRIKEMVNGLYGRVGAYGQGLASTDSRPLEIAVENNVYGTAESVLPAQVSAMAGYVRREALALGAQPLPALLAGRVAYGPPPVPPGDAGC